MITLPVIPAPPIALNGYADDKVNALVTEIENDSVDVGESNDSDLNGNGVNENNGDDLNCDGVNESNDGDNVDDGVDDGVHESNDGDLNGYGVHENNGDDLNCDDLNCDGINKGDLGDNDDDTNDNCNRVEHNGNVLKNMDSKTKQNTCGDVDQKHSASNISGRTSINSSNYLIF